METILISRYWTSHPKYWFNIFFPNGNRVWIAFIFFLLALFLLLLHIKNHFIILLTNPVADFFTPYNKIPSDCLWKFTHLFMQNCCILHFCLILHGVKIKYFIHWLQLCPPCILLHHDGIRLMSCLLITCLYKLPLSTLVHFSFSLPRGKNRKSNKRVILLQY